MIRTAFVLVVFFVAVMMFGCATPWYVCQPVNGVGLICAPFHPKSTGVTGPVAEPSKGASTPAPKKLEM